jgi:hypothetical protein
MKTTITYSAIFAILCFSIISCQKIDLRPQDKSLNSLNETDVSASLNSSVNLVAAPFIAHDDDSIERKTTLGIKLTNPYLIPNMQQAYSNLGLSSSLAAINNLYVRFLPSGIDQLAILDSTMEAQGLELFDTPVDYDVTYEGDYYQDPSITEEQITWQYAVVPPDFQFPTGIQHETLAQIHIPADDYTAVETEAERLASKQDSINLMSSNSTFGTLSPQIADDCINGYHWDPFVRDCVKDDPSDPPPPPAPPAPAIDAAIPAGNIYVFDTNLNSNMPVRKARVVARRWFKIERTYTDNNGHFVFTKRFKHKVRINVKFKNEYAQVRNVRGIRFWQMLFPVKYTLGIYNGDKSNITKIFGQFQDYSAKGNMFWTAATVHNGVQEYRDYASSEHIGMPPQGLKIFVSKTGMAGSGGATPMFGKRAAINLASEYVLFRISSVASIVNNIIAIIKAQMDMVIGYRYETDGHRDITQLLSDRLKEATYHELTHAEHYAALGNSWYTPFVNAEIFEIVNNFSSGYKPYGDGSNSQSEIIALGEGWAYHIGHFFADKKYPNSSSEQYDQSIKYNNSDPIPVLSSHLNLLEEFSPYRTDDPFHWIPTGLFYDMFDMRNEQKATGGPVDDNVSGYTNLQMFKAFSSGITTLSGYKTNLLQQNSNNQSVQVIYLFSQYGY